jgi:hypothetical protein
MTDNDSSSKRSREIQPLALPLLRKFLLVALTAWLGWGLIHPGKASAQEAAASPAQPPRQDPEGEAPSFTFKAITRMVIVEVVVRDAEDNPVRDLTAKDLVVSEAIDGSTQIPQTIALLQPVEGAVASTRATPKGIVLNWLHKSFCPLSGAYELSYYLSPDSRKDGLHKIQVTSLLRPGLRLFFRPGYKIEADKTTEVTRGELTEKQTDTQLRTQRALELERKEHPELELAVLACYDALETTNFQLQVNKISSKKGDSFEFVVPGSYFASLPLSERDYPRKFDFSLCTFAYNGQPVRQFEGTIQNTSSSSQLTSQGFTHTLNFDSLQPSFQAPQPPALSARLVVRDHRSGALGSAEILLLPISRDLYSVPIPESQTNESFGTVSQDDPAAMCGDVYLLAPWTVNLPRFSEIDATAPVYTNSFGVYSRFFKTGIPGVTNRTEWFGINYQGSFGVDNPGKYEFSLLSDDGAKVYIDDKLVVSDDTVHPVQRSRSKVLLDKGAHTLRVSYFQGPRTEVALVLLIKSPGRGWRIFDARDFPVPGSPSAQRPSQK